MKYTIIHGKNASYIGRKQSNASTIAALMLVLAFAALGFYEIARLLFQF